jgi:hypothetical protein
MPEVYLMGMGFNSATQDTMVIHNYEAILNLQKIMKSVDKLSVLHMQAPKYLSGLT